MSGSLTPRTWFSGRSAPEDKRGPEVTTWMTIALIVVSPIGALVALGGYLLFTMGRFSWRVIAGATATYGALFLLFGGFSGPFVRDYFTPWREFIAALTANFNVGEVADTVGQNWVSWLGAQIWPSILLGGCYASAVSAYKWMRRASWEASDRRPGPLQVLRAKRLRTGLAEGTVRVPDGHTIGVTPEGKHVVQTEAEGSAHTLVAGGSGSGKTTTMLAGIRDDIRNGESVIFVDLKGASDVPAQLAAWAAEHGREFRHWLIHDRRTPYTGPADGPAYYDPIRRGDPSRRKDLLIGSQRWDVEYYKTVIEGYLQPAFALADLTPNPNADSFTDLLALLDSAKLSHRAGHLLRHSALTPEGQQRIYGEPDVYKWSDYIPYVIDPDIQQVLSSVDAVVRDLTDQERSGIRNMMSRMQTLAQSTAGNWLRRDPEGRNDIDLGQAAREGWVVVFTLDSSRYEQTAKTVGGLIIQDIKTLSSELREEPAPTPTHLYVDEFSALGSDNILGLLARARDARIPTTLSTQALADLTKADPAFLDQCLGIVNCFMIHRANKEGDAVVLAGLGGKHTVFKKQYGIEMTSGSPGSIGEGAATGTGFLREDEQYVVTPNQIQSLKQGELVYIANSPERRVEHPVQVIRPAKPSQNSRAARTEPQSPVALVDGNDAPAAARQALIERASTPWTGADPVVGERPEAAEGRTVAALASVPEWDRTSPTPEPETAAEWQGESPAPEAAPPRRPAGPPVIDPTLLRSRDRSALAVPPAGPTHLTPPAVAPIPDPVVRDAAAVPPLWPASDVTDPVVEPSPQPEMVAADSAEEPPDEDAGNPAEAQPASVLALEPDVVEVRPEPEPEPEPEPVVVEAEPVVVAPPAPVPAPVTSARRLPVLRPSPLSAPWLDEQPLDEFDREITTGTEDDASLSPFGDPGELAATGWSRSKEAGLMPFGSARADEDSITGNVPTTSPGGMFPRTHDNETNWS